MRRIANTFEKLKNENKKALIPYIMAGFPQKKDTVMLMHTLVDAGANIIELGIPFSDPMADGEVIQKAAEKALEQKTSMVDVLAMVATFREQDKKTPIVLMGYANPIERFNALHEGSFVAQMANAGVDGLLIVDYPPEECVELSVEMNAAGLDLILLLAPTSNKERIQKIANIASGYVYYVSLKGVTGSKALDIGSVESNMHFLHEYITIPIGVGFGIRDAETAAEIAHIADGVVIGSKLLSILQICENITENQQRISEFVSEVRQALDKK